MKKLITIILILTMIMPAYAMCGELAKAQKYFYNTKPSNIESYEFEITGTIVDIGYTANKHMTLTLTVNDDDAWTGITYDYDLPCCLATMPYHHEFDLPYNIGEEITITGIINEFYSTVMVPNFTIRRINGTKIEDWFEKFVWEDEE